MTCGCQPELATFLNKGVSIARRNYQLAQYFDHSALFMQTGLSQMHLALYRVQPLFHSEVKGGVSTNLFRPRIYCITCCFHHNDQRDNKLRRGGVYLGLWFEEMHSTMARKKYQKEAHRRLCV